jgi:hypothetical protein
MRHGPRLFLLTAALAGCLQRGHPAPAPAAPGMTATAAAAPTEASPSDPPPPAPAAAAPFPHEVRLSGCLNPRMLFFLDPTAAQALLPPGYKAADATGLLRYVGFPQPPAVATGRAVAGYDFLSCAKGSLDSGPQSFSEIGVFIDPPAFGNTSGSEATNLDLYLLGLHTTSPAWRALLQSAGFDPQETLAATIASAQAIDPAGFIQGQGSVAGSAPLATATWDGAADGNPLSIHGRYWHSNAVGTFYLDFRLDETVYAGAIASCTHAPGSSYEQVSGTRTCTNQPRFAAVGVNSTIAGGMHWQPGQWPVS